MGYYTPAGKIDDHTAELAKRIFEEVCEITQSIATLESDKGDHSIAVNTLLRVSENMKSDIRLLTGKNWAETGLELGWF